MRSIQVRTASHSYPVHIGAGIFAKLPDVLAETGISPSKILLITDTEVDRLHGEKIKAVLDTAAPWCQYTAESGEQAKSFQSFFNVQSFALKEKLDRKSLILAAGGGVVGDLAGFCAATYMRGIPFIQIPTTLLAHDSAVGGKTAINHPEGKNMIGAFYQPEAVLFDTDFLETLPLKELRSGLSEVIKHALIKDEEMLDSLLHNVNSPEEISSAMLEELIDKGISIKAAIVSEDEKEQGIRSFLNFGHTLGHALEKIAGYGFYTHGDAVACGMAFALWLSERTLAKQLRAKEIVSWFKKLGYPVRIPENFASGELLDAMEKDKKAESGSIHMILLSSIGSPVKHPFKRTELEKLLNEWRLGGQL